MSEVLVLVDHVDGVVKKPALELLTLARRIGDPSAVILGHGVDGAKMAAELGEYGAERVYMADDPAFVEYLVVPKVDALTQIVDSVGASAVLITSSPKARKSQPESPCA